MHPSAMSWSPEGSGLCNSGENTVHLDSTEEICHDNVKTCNKCTGNFYLVHLAGNYSVSSFFFFFFNLVKSYGCGSGLIAFHSNGISPCPVILLRVHVDELLHMFYICIM